MPEVVVLVMFAYGVVPCVLEVAVWVVAEVAGIFGILRLLH